MTPKMYIFRRLLWLMLLLVLLSGSACQQNVGQGPTPDQTALPVTVETTAPAPTELPLVQDGTAICRIVRPENGTQAEINAAVELMGVISRLTGVAPTITTDWIKPGDSYDSTTVEILVGNTAYPESAAVLEETGYGAYSVAVRGNKLVVAAWSNKGLTAGSSALIDQIIAHAEEGRLLYPVQTLTHPFDTQLSALPHMEGGEVAYVQDAGVPTGRTARQITFTEVDAADFDAYCEALTAGGYLTVQENIIGQNRYVTCSDGTLRVTAYHMPLTKSIRVIVEDDRPIGQTAGEYTTVCDTTLMQLGLDKNNPELDSAMNAYVVQLADGRFILVDTGTSSAASYLYQYMKANTPAGEKIRIAAVFITHPHVDHMDGIKTLASRYAKEIECEAVYLNYGAFSMQNRYSESTFRNHWDSMAAAAKQLGAELYVVRTGQRIEITNAVFEVLWCPEDFGNKIIEDYNDGCVVFRMTVGDSTTIFLGDCRDKASPVVVNMYRDALKCDIITVAHHGYGGSVFPLYEYASASIVFWPNTFIEERDVNRKLLAMDCVEHHYLAADGDIVITLAEAGK